jgi:hypothetical protein
MFGMIMHSPTTIIRVFVAFSLAVGWGTATLCTEAAAVETVSIVFGNEAPQLERLAANELASQFRRLFQNVTVTVGMEPTGEATHVVLVVALRRTCTLGVRPKNSAEP